MMRPIQKNLYSCTAFLLTFRGEEITIPCAAPADNSGVVTIGPVAQNLVRHTLAHVAKVQLRPSKKSPERHDEKPPFRKFIAVAQGHS